MSTRKSPAREQFTVRSLTNSPVSNERAHRQAQLRHDIYGDAYDANGGDANAEEED